MAAGSVKNQELTKSHWDGDKLHRELEANILYNYLMNVYDTEKRHTLNINSEWGKGKTYFLERFKKDLEIKEHKVVYFNAWENDFSDDALISLISEISDQAFKTNAKIKKALINFAGKISSPAKNIAIAASTLVDPTLGSALVLAAKTTEDEITKDNKSSSKDRGELLHKSHKEKKLAIEKFKKELALLISQLNRPPKPPIFILIDELDRCRPTFSISILESIKHLFGIDGIFFIIATDTKQLCCTVNAIYGEKFKSETYINRFFDGFYALNEPSKLGFIRLLTDEIPNDTIVSIPDIEKNNSGAESNHTKAMEVVFSNFGFSLRDIEQCVFKYKTIIRLNTSNIPIFTILLIFLISLKHKSNEYYLDFKNHETPSKLNDIQINILMTGSALNYHTSRGSKEFDLSLIDVIKTYLECVKADAQTFSEKKYPTNAQRAIITSLDQRQFNRHELLLTYYQFIERSSNISDTVIAHDSTSY